MKLLLPDTSDLDQQTTVEVCHRTLMTLVQCPPRNGRKRRRIHRKALLAVAELLGHELLWDARIRAEEAET
jgi:hypothetical protein